MRVGTTDGRTAFGDERLSRAMRPDDEQRDALVVAYAGIAAERAVLGEAASGGSSDVATATEIALERVQAGLTDRATPIDLDQLARNVAETLKAEWAVDLADQVLAARERAIAIVVANVEPIRRFADRLESARELTGEALVSAIAEAGFVRSDRSSHAS